MRTWKHNLVAVILALCQSLLSLSSSGLLLCVGADGHVALVPAADGHCKDLCPRTAEPATPDPMAGPAMDDTECVDTALQPAIRHEPTQVRTRKPESHRGAVWTPPPHLVPGFGPDRLRDPVPRSGSRIGVHPTLALLSTILLRL